MPHCLARMPRSVGRSVIKGGALRLPVGERDGDDGGAPAAGWALGDRVYRGYARSGSGGGVEDGLRGPCDGEEGTRRRGSSAHR